MLYHALSLANQGVDVDLVGRAGELPARVGAHPRIRCRIVGRAAMAVEAWRLLRTLLSGARPDAILVQIPPSVPSLAVTVAAARLRRTRLIVDWHNLTSSMLALRIGPRRLPLAMVDAHDRLASRRADAHLCVSGAMKSVLERRGIAGVTVFRDRPADVFRRADGETRDGWVRRLWPAIDLPAHECFLVVVPSSWGLDDDFDLLRDAIDRCEALLDERRSRAWIGLVLTGKGERRDAYRARFEERLGRRVHGRAVWCAFEEYAELVGCADLGVSIHRSASGLDLPMKICDLFGAGVPVCALDYGPCLAELVRHDANGLLFGTAEALARQIVDVCDDRNGVRMTRLRDGASRAAAVRWHEGWLAEAWPVVRGETAS